MTARPAPDPTCVLRGHRADVQAVAFHPHNSLLLYTGDASGEARVWDLDQRRAIQTSRLHSYDAGIICLKFATPTKLLSQGRNGSIKAWEVDADGKVGSSPRLDIFTDAYSFCRLDCCTFHSGENALASEAVQVDNLDVQLGDEAVQGGSLQQTQQISNLSLDDEPQQQGALAAALTRHTVPGGQELKDGLHDGKTYVVAPYNDPSAAAIWDVETGELVLLLSQPAGTASHGMCMSLKFAQPAAAAAKLLLFVGYEDGVVSVWDTACPKQPLASVRLHAEPIMSLALDSTGQGGVTAAADSKLVCFQFDAVSNGLMSRAELPVSGKGIGDVAIRGDDRIVAAGGWDNKITIFNYKKLTRLAILKYHRAAVTAFTFSESHDKLVSASRDGSVALWCIYPPKLDVDA